jgi:hypothetical protein
VQEDVWGRVFVFSPTRSDGGVAAASVMDAASVALSESFVCGTAGEAGKAVA